MISFVSFFDPYIPFLIGAAYNIKQTLDGLGITSSNVLTLDANGEIIGGYFSPFETLSPILGALILYSFILIVLVGLAFYVLGRWKGVAVALLVLLIPGIIATFDYWPTLRYLPDRFVIHGTGSLGSVMGMFPLVFIGLLTGWSIVLILSDIFQFRDRFRHYYDHFWYSMAVLAGLFFVADSNTSEIVQELREANQVSRQSSAYLLQQVRAYDSWCQSIHSKNIASCAWATDVQQILSDYSSEDERVFQSFGPKSSTDIYSPIRRNTSPQEVQTIRRELMAYNLNRCPVTPIGDGLTQLAKSSGTCQRPPAVFCTAFPELLDGERHDSSVWRTVAIANEAIIPSLVRLRSKQEELNAKVLENAKAKHGRWFFFVLFSIVAGGKVANATSRAIVLDQRTKDDQRRALQLLKIILDGIKKSIGAIMKLCGNLLNVVLRRLKMNK